MDRILTWSYIISGFICLILVGDFALRAFKRKSIKNLVESADFEAKTIIALCVCFVAAPFHFWYFGISVVPEGTYTINAVLEVDGDENKYSVPVTFEYFKEIEYTDDYKNDPLFDGGISYEVEVKEVFWVLDVASPKTINVKEFVFEHLDGLPETIESNKVYGIDVVGYSFDGYEDNGDPILYEDFVDGHLVIPPITKENLGITIEDQMKSIGVYSYAEHLFLFFASGMCLLACIKKKKQ